MPPAKMLPKSRSDNEIGLASLLDEVDRRHERDVALEQLDRMSDGPRRQTPAAW